MARADVPAEFVALSTVFVEDKNCIASPLVRRGIAGPQRYLSTQWRA